MNFLLELLSPLTIILFFSRALRKGLLRFWFAWHGNISWAVIIELPACRGMRRLCWSLGLCVVYRKAELSEYYLLVSNATKP